MGIYRDLIELKKAKLFVVKEKPIFELQNFLY